MAGPLNGIGGQQQAPLAQPSQSGQDTNQVRGRNDQEAQQNQVQPQGAPAADTQNSETNNNDVLQQQIRELLDANGGEEGLNANAPRRGSLVDIAI